MQKFSTPMVINLTITVQNVTIQDNCFELSHAANKKELPTETLTRVISIAKRFDTFVPIVPAVIDFLKKGGIISICL